VKKTLVFAFLAVLVAGALGCSSWSRTTKGATVGAATGAVVGGVIGNQAGNTAAGAIIGAAVGGAAGAYIGHYMDEQAEEMERDLEGATVERIGEGIKITFDSGLLFDVDKAKLKVKSEESLRGKPHQPLSNPQQVRRYRDPPRRPHRCYGKRGTQP
jgi:outer membrane protein OmpA-like peptidoglycan-associated protein